MARGKSTGDRAHGIHVTKIGPPRSWTLRHLSNAGDRFAPAGRADAQWRETGGPQTIRAFSKIARRSSWLTDKQTLLRRGGWPLLVTRAGRPLGGAAGSAGTKGMKAGRQRTDMVASRRAHCLGGAAYLSSTHETNVPTTRAILYCRAGSLVRKLDPHTRIHGAVLN